MEIDRKLLDQTVSRRYAHMTQIYLMHYELRCSDYNRNSGYRLYNIKNVAVFDNKNIHVNEIT